MDIGQIEEVIAEATRNDDQRTSDLALSHRNLSLAVLAFLNHLGRHSVLTIPAYNSAARMAEAARLQRTGDRGEWAP